MLRDKSVSNPNAFGKDKVCATVKASFDTFFQCLVKYQDLYLLRVIEQSD